VGCKKNRKTIGPTESKPQCRGAAGLGLTVLHAVEGWQSLPDESSDSEWSLSNMDQTAHTLTNEGRGWTPVTSKKQRLKSVAKISSSPNNWPSLPGPSIVEANGNSNSTATKRFPANRVEVQELKSREHLRREFADNMDYVRHQTPNSSCHLESARLDSFLSSAGSSRPNLFSTHQESIFRPDSAHTGLTEARMPVSSSHPSLNSSPETRRVDFGNTPKSQWECLEQISPLQIHHTLDLANKTRKGVLSTEAESQPPFDTYVSPQTGLNFSWAPPAGVSTLCEHFLEDNRKGQPFRQPKPCSNCTKRSKLAYGIWRRDTKEWQVMRPYPRDVSPSVPFQLCWHFDNGVKCQKSPCTFAHCKEELAFWTSERQSGRSQSCPEVDTQSRTEECLFVCLFVVVCLVWVCAVMMQTCQVDSMSSEKLNEFSSFFLLCD